MDLIHDLLRDVRLAVRGLSRRPGFAALSVGTLSLGIGGGTAVFSVVQGVLLSRLPYPAADRIVHLAAEHPGDGVAGRTFRVAEWRAFHDGAATLEAVGGAFPTPTTLTGTGDAVRLEALRVTPGWFDVFGVRPAHGRLLDDADARTASPVAVLSHALWAGRLGADTARVGGRVVLDGTPFTVVGVAPASFAPPGGPADVYLPHALGTEGWVGRWLEVHARLAPGASAAAAREEMAGLMARVGEAEARSAGWVAGTRSLREATVGAVRETLLLLLAAVGVLLLIACADVANLFLARAVVRDREIAVRKALGGGRARIARGVLVEAAVVAVAAAIVGVGLAVGGLELLLALAPDSLPRLDAVRIDGRVLAFTGGVAAATALLFGAVPAARSAGADPGALGRSSPGGGPRSGRGVLGGLVVAEIALSLVLLVAAGLLVRSARGLQAVDPGFRSAGALAFEVALPAARYPEPSDVLAYFEGLRTRLGRLPGVEGVAVTSWLPLTTRGSWARVHAADAPGRAGEDGAAVLQRTVGPDFFEVLGVPVLEGRGLEPGDGDGPPVVVVSRSLADRLWPGGSAVGRRMGFGAGPGGEAPEVVGVVGDVRYESLRGASDPQYYEPHGARAFPAMHVVVRTAGSVEAAAAPVAAEARALDPGVPVHGVRSLDDLRERASADARFAVFLFGVLGGVALLLVLAGTYGVLSFAVARRRREMGVRAAVGADAAALHRLVLGDALRWATAGGALGVALGLPAARLLDRLLFGVGPADPAAFAAALVLLSSSALAAGWLPARSAARADPAAVLRGE